MNNIYAYINELRKELDRLIEDHLNDLNNPKIIQLSEKLDTLIVFCMQDNENTAS
ncbi:MAG: aspartyl-phosphate phosphatase Spo0E family protein [Eubacteriales bacterium]